MTAPSPDVSFVVRAGEIVGLGGLVGSGRTEIARVLFGVDRPSGGTICLDGQPVSPRLARPGARARASPTCPKIVSARAW